MIRFFDIVFSFFGILLLFPLFVIVYILLVLESKGGGRKGGRKGLIGRKEGGRKILIRRKEEMYKQQKQ